MKRKTSILTKIAIIFLFTGVFIQVQKANSQTVSLPDPQKEGGMELMQAISERKTARDFSDKEIDAQTLSDILYAAWGISHEDKRTIPTAKNLQDFSVYVVLKKGTYRYDAQTNGLVLVDKKDNRPLLAMQDFVKTAPLTLVFTGKESKYAPMHAGSAYQNVGLYAASKGLNNVVRGAFEPAEITKVLNLPADEYVIVTQTIGWPAEK